MKIWPFDPAAEKSDGQYISRPDLKTRAGAVREDSPRGRRPHGRDGRISFAVAASAGDDDRQGAWRPSRRSGTRIRSRWTASPALARYAAASPAPICASETLGSLCAFRDLLETGAAGVIMLDLAWCGGISEARKIAAMAEAWHLPVAPHDCTGPVVFCGFDPSLAQRAERARPGKRARLLPDLVSRPRRRAARSERRRDQRRPPARASGSNCIRISPSVITVEIRATALGDI